MISDEVGSRVERIGKMLKTLPNDRLADLKHAEDWKGTFRFIFNEPFTDKEEELWLDKMSKASCEPTDSIDIIYDGTL